MSTEQTERTSSWSATAATGRFSGSSTSTRTRALSGRSAPRQRRGRNGLIGVSAISGALNGKIVGGRSGRGCHQHPVGDQFAQPLLAVDQDAQARRLIGLAIEENVVEGMKLHRGAVIVVGAHEQRVDYRDLGLR